MPLKPAAELIGTFAPIFVGAGSIVAAQETIDKATPGLVTIALAHGLVILRRRRGA